MPLVPDSSNSFGLLCSFAFLLFMRIKKAHHFIFFLLGVSGTDTPTSPVVSKKGNKNKPSGFRVPASSVPAVFLPSFLLPSLLFPSLFVCWKNQKGGFHHQLFSVVFKQFTWTNTVVIPAEWTRKEMKESHAWFEPFTPSQPHSVALPGLIFASLCFSSYSLKWLIGSCLA